MAVVGMRGGGVAKKIVLKRARPPVAVVIRAGGSHPRLFAPVFVKCNTGHDRDIREGSVVIVVIQNARSAIAGHVNIRPAVVIEVQSRNAERKMTVGAIYVGLGSNIGKSTVAAVLIKNVFGTL